MLFQNNVLLIRSLLDLLDLDPYCGEADLCASMSQEGVFLYYSPSYQKGREHDPTIGQWYTGAAATAIWEFFHENRLIYYWSYRTNTFHRYLEASYPVSMGEEDTGKLAAHELPTLHQCLARHRRLLQLLSASALTTAQFPDPVLTLAEVQGYTSDVAVKLNDRSYNELEYFRKGMSSTTPATRVRFLASWTGYTCWDNITVAQVTAAHCRPLQIAGIWVDLRHHDPQESLRVLVAFDDTRQAGARYDLARTKFYTRQVCLHQGINRLRLSGDDRAWAAKKGQPAPDNPNIRFIPWEEITGGPSVVGPAIF